MFQETIRRIGDYSKYYYDGENVTKTIDAGTNIYEARRKFEIVTYEYSLIKAYLKIYSLSTNFIIDQTNEQFVIKLTQEYVEGKPLREVLDRKHPQREFKDFLICCLKLYRNEGICPDLVPDLWPDPSGQVDDTGIYAGHSPENVRVNFIPILIDNTLNGISRNAKLGPAVHLYTAYLISRMLI